MNTSAGNPNRLFHDALAKAAHNPALVQVYESGRHLFFRLPFYWKLFDDAQIKMTRAERHEMARRWHEQIFKAIVERDAAEAEGAMFQHLDIMEKDLLTRLQSADGDEQKSPALFSSPVGRSRSGEEKNLGRESLAAMKKHDRTTGAANVLIACAIVSFWRHRNCKPPKQSRARCSSCAWDSARRRRRRCPTRSCGWLKT